MRLQLIKVSKWRSAAMITTIAALFSFCSLASAFASSGSGGTSGTTAPTLSSGIYVRSDSDKTTVITPQVHFRSGLGREGKTGIDVVYTADMWTSASVDVRSAASREVSEQRDEVTVGVDHTKGLMTFGAGYRFSHEVDYVSNGLSLSGKMEAFQRSSTFELRLTGARDIVGRSGDDSFEKSITTTGLWLGYTQVLTRYLLAQLSYEWRQSTGYQASPYRYVSIGGAPGSCGQAVGTCIAEVHPGIKRRHATVLRLRHSLGKHLSLGAGYRYYWDLWKLRSHTAIADLSYSTAKGVMLRAEYRGYTQGRAFFYRERYASLAESRYFTRDRELSALKSHRGALLVDYTPKFKIGPLSWTMGVMGAVTRYVYSEFVGLDRVTALEAAANLGVGF